MFEVWLVEEEGDVPLSKAEGPDMPSAARTGGMLDVCAGVIYAFVGTVNNVVGICSRVRMHVQM